MTSIISGMEKIASQFSVAYVDQWGVIHDGHKPYPGVLDCLKSMRQAGLFVLYLSNSSRTAKTIAPFLASLGVHYKMHYDALMTSGDSVVRSALGVDGYMQQFGGKVYALGWGAYPESEPLAAELARDKDHQEFFAKSAVDSDWILLIGYDPTKTIDYYKDSLAAAADKKVPMVCANPDMVTVTPSGRYQPCPGLIAKEYEKIGGKVFWHGKPLPLIYQLAQLQMPQHAPEKAIGIGDSLAHDIRGISTHKGKSLLVAGGIHKKEIISPDSGDVDLEKLAALAETTNEPQPDFVIKSLVW